MSIPLAIIRGLNGSPNTLYDRGTPIFTITGALAGGGGTGKFTIAGDHTIYFVAGATFIVTASTDNNGTYTVVSSVLVGTDTVITVTETVTSSVVDGIITKQGWTLLGTFVTDYAIPDILAFVNLALIINGYEVPWSYSGVTLQHLTSSSGAVPVGASHHALHQGFYWLWNTAAVSAGFDGPSSLRSSDLNNPNSWPNANQLFLDKDDGDAGQGIGQFTIAESGISPSTSLILFKSFASYQMTGVFGSTSPQFAVQKVKSDMGCIAPRTIKFCPGFGLIRFSHRGFTMFNGVDDQLISEQVRPLIFGSVNFTALDFGHVAEGYACVVPNPPMYVCALPIDGFGLTRVFCYDLVRKAWTVLQFPNAFACMEVINHPNQLPQVLQGDFRLGKVRQLFNGALTDDGIEVAWQAIPRAASMPSPQTNAYWRRLIIKVADVSGGQTIDVLIPVGPAIPARSVSHTLTVPAAVGTAPTVSDLDLTADIGLIGTNVRAVLSGTGRIRLRGLEFHGKVKPLRRVSMLY